MSSIPKGNIIIGKSIDGSPIRTNVPTSELFDCQALRDQAKKKKELRDKLFNEVASRDC